MRYNPDNERLKHRYFRRLSSAKQLDEQTVDAAAKAINRFEAFTSHRCFSEFRADHASAFRLHLLNLTNDAGKPLSKSTIVHTLNTLKRFFAWVPEQAGYKRLDLSWAEYFNPSLRDVAIARAVREQPVPTLEQVQRAVLAMPATSDVELRDRAILSLIAITGARDRAVASLKLKHIDVGEKLLFQDGRDVRTKFGKTISTWFFPVDEDLEKIVVDWVRHLRELGFGAEDPLFPASIMSIEDGRPVVSLGRESWTTAGPIRKLFKNAFVAAGMRYFNPHSFRNMLTRVGMKVCHTPEDLKAWSQNLGHDGILVTLNSYGDLPSHLQRDLIRNSASRSEDDRLALELGYQALRAAKISGR